ncbi:MAG: hypothetical protein ACI9FJ_000749 [Alteromonadaceae bacterium]|jgi:hypothetical protein
MKKISMNNVIDETSCPLCGDANLCAMTDNNSQENQKLSKLCWCAEVKFTALKDVPIPEAAKGKSCICQCCVKKLKLAKAL